MDEAQSKAPRSVSPIQRSSLMLIGFLPVLFPALLCIYSYHAFNVTRVVGLTEIGAWLLFITLLWRGLRNGLNSIELSFESKLFLGFAGGLFLIGLFINPFNYLVAPLTLIALSFGPLTLVLCQRYGHDGISLLLKSMVLAYACYALLYIFITATGIYETPFYPKVKVAYPGFDNIRNIAAHLGVAIMLGCYLGANAQKQGETFHALFWVLATSLICFLALHSGSRALLGAIIVGFAFTLLICKPFRLLSALHMSSAMVLGATIALLFNPTHSHFGIRSIFFRLSGDVIEGFQAGRLSIWRAGIKSINDSPWLGHGVGNFAKASDYLPGDVIYGAHNIFIAYAHALGYLGGGAIVLWLFVKWLRASIHYRMQTSPLAISAFASLNFLLLFSLFNALSYRIYPLIFAAIILAVVIHYMKTTRD